MEGLLYYMCLVFVLTIEGTIISYNTNCGLYCTDPDTGKLYEVNSTWPSQSFCGNYTCKLTKANITKTEYTPVPKTTNENEEHEEKEKGDEEKTVLGIQPDARLTLDMAVSPSEVIKTIKKVNDVKLKASKESTAKKLYNVSKTSNDKRDRLLTEAEINVITEILHTVKKSDLEAIIEVYNLAEEIYNEIEKSSKNNKAKSNLDRTLVNEISCNDKSDMNTEGTTLASRYYAYPANYFRGGLTSYNYQQPYYYPMSGYPGTSPYVYTPQISNMWKPCAKTKSNTIPAPIAPPSVGPARAKDEPMTTASPYTSLNIRQNIEDYARYYYNYYPWAQLEVYNKNRLPYYINSYYPQPNEKPSKIVKIQPSEKSKIPKEVKPKSKVIQKELPVKKAQEKKETMPKWKTEQLSQQVIDEVKANVLEKTKLPSIFPGIQLERVGKVLKLDELTRLKRHAEMKEHEDFEVRLERIECETSTEPGYFSVGNLSAPYPDCCPQKIT